MRFHTPYKTLSLVSLSIALALLAAWIYILYASFGMKADMETADKAAADASAKDSYLLSLKKAVADSRDDIESIEKRFISEDDVPNFIDILEKRAASAGVSADLGSISLDEAEEGSVVRNLRLRLSGRGDWDKVVSLVASLESLPYALEIRSLSVTKTEGTDSEDGFWNFAADLIQRVTTNK